MNLPYLPLLGCFFCGVDSRVLLIFFLVFVVSVILASLSFLCWAIARGDFRNIEQTKYDIFQDPEAGLPDAVCTPPLADETSISRGREL